MSVPPSDIPLPAPNPPAPRMPWSVRDTWLGLGLLVLIQILIVGFVVEFKPVKIYGSLGVILLECIYIIPVVIILTWRRADWKLLGFRRFDRRMIGVGCGLLMTTYLIVFLNNAIFVLLGKNIQTYEIMRLLGTLPSPYSFVIAAVFLAPLVEESFFRGFLFTGFRQRYGWKWAAGLSSAFFAILHLELSVLIPTFLLGFVFSYLYEKSNSILPGMLLHFLVNSFALTVILLLPHLSGAIPR